MVGTRPYRRRAVELQVRSSAHGLAGRDQRQRTRAARPRGGAGPAARGFCGSTAIAPRFRRVGRHDVQAWPKRCAHDGVHAVVRATTARLAGPATCGQVASTPSAIACRLRASRARPQPGSAPDRCRSFDGHRSRPDVDAPPRTVARTTDGCPMPPGICSSDRLVRRQRQSPRWWPIDDVLASTFVAPRPAVAVALDGEARRRRPDLPGARVDLAVDRRPVGEVWRQVDRRGRRLQIGPA